MTSYSQSGGVTRSSPRAWMMAALLAMAPACATEPPPRPAQIDPANPASPESRPLEVSQSPPAPEEEAHATKTPSSPAPNVADEHATHQSLGVASSGAHSTAQQEVAPIYQCPMHPEVVSEKPGVCPKCGMRLERKMPPPKPGKAHDHNHGGGASP